MQLMPTPLVAADTEFVGRDAELATLRAAVTGAITHDDLRVVVVAGEAGMGKTRLVTQALDGLDGVTVLAGSCLDLGEASLPYGPVVDALRGAPQTPAVTAALDDGARAVLARLFPELGSVGDVPASLESLHVGHTQLYEQLLRLLAALAADRPVVMVIEDLHWSEPSTRDLLAFLAANLRDVPLCLVLTYRSDEVGRAHPLRRLLGAVDRDPRTTRIELAPLDDVSLTRLVLAYGGEGVDPATIEEIISRSGGNPFFAQELVAAGPAVPPALEDVLLARVDALSPDAQTVVRCAAAAGREVAHDLLPAMTGLDDGRLDAALREAVDARILQVDAARAGYAFRHALQQEAIHDSLLPGERARLHSQLASLLAGDGITVANAARLARHYELSHQLDRALQASFVAGRAAVDASAHADGYRHLEKVLELWDQVPDAEELIGVDLPEVLKKAALCAISSYEDKRGLALAKRALELLDPATEPTRSAILWMWIGHGRRHYSMRTAMDAYRTAVQLVPTDPPSAARAQVLAAYGTKLWLSGDREGEPVCREAVDVARAVGSRRDESYALISLGSISATWRLDPSGLDELARAREMAVADGRWDLVLRADVNSSDALDVLGRHDEAVRCALDGVELARRHGLFRTHGAFLLGNAIESLERLGRLDEARRLADEFMAFATGTSAHLHALVGRASVAVWDDDGDLAASLLDRAGRVMGEDPEPQWTSRLAVWRARAALAAGEADTAWSIAVDELTRHPDPSLARRTHGALLAVAADAARTGDAAADVRRLSGWLDDTGPQCPEDAAHRRALAAHLAVHDGGSPAEAWGAALAAYAELGMRAQHAHALLAAARDAVVAGDRATAEVWWKDAAVTARAIGSALLLRRADALGRRAGFTRGDRDDPFALTPREQEVLRLVAEGLSNREIGERLFISTKTASVHVSNILAKLGVASRGQAAAAAHRAGLLD